MIQTRRIFLMLFMLLIGSIAKAQFVKVKLQAIGLTCSMCPFATEKTLRTIDFIDRISRKLGHTTFILYLKKNAKVDLDKNKLKVENAGDLSSKTTNHISGYLEKTNNYHYQQLGDKIYHFIDVKNRC